MITPCSTTFELSSPWLVWLQSRPSSIDRPSQEALQLCKSHFFLVPPFRTYIQIYQTKIYTTENCKFHLSPMTCLGQMLDISVDTLRGMTCLCIIQSQQPPLPPTCLKITKESLFLGRNAHSIIVCKNCNNRHHLLMKQSYTLISIAMALFRASSISILYIESTLGVSV